MLFPKPPVNGAASGEERAAKDREKHGLPAPAGWGRFFIDGKCGRWRAADVIHVRLHLANLLVAQPGLLLQCLEHDAIEPDVHLHALRGRGENAARTLAGEHFVEGDAEGEDVGALVGVAGLLLGGHVVGGAHDGMGAGERAGLPGDGSGKAEVGELGAAFGGDEDVAGFDVAVDDVFRVGVMQGVADLGDDFQRLRGVQAGAGEDALEVGAIDVFHREIEQPGTRLAEVVNGNDARVLEPGEGLRLTTETGDEVLVRSQLGWEEFDGDGTIEGGLHAAIDGSHSTATDERGDFIQWERAREFRRLGRRPRSGSGGRFHGIQRAGEEVGGWECSDACRSFLGVHGGVGWRLRF